MSDLPHYQTIPELDIVGRMDTTQEFDRIGLPESFAEKGHRKVLDVGCNAGAFMLECLKREAEYVFGIDVNPLWAERAKATMAYAKHDLKLKGTSSVICADATTYLEKFKASWRLRFNYVLCLSVTHLVDQPDKLVQGCLNSLYPDGLLILEVNHRLEKTPVMIPPWAIPYGKNKDNRTVYHIFKDNR